MSRLLIITTVSPYDWHVYVHVHPKLYLVLSSIRPFHWIRNVTNQGDSLSMQCQGKVPAAWNRLIAILVLILGAHKETNLKYNWLENWVQLTKSAVFQSYLDSVTKKRK